MNTTTYLRIIHVINHLMIIPAVIYGNVYWWLGAIVWWYIIAVFGISIGFHRMLSHRSIRAPQWFGRMCISLGCLVPVGSPIGWAGVHMMHHAYSETDKDPHSPKNGFWKSYLHLWTLDTGNTIPRRFVVRWFKNPFLKFWHRHYFKMLAGWIVLLFLINPLAPVFFFSITSVIAFHAFASVNCLSHTFGYRNFAVNDDSRCNWYANVLTLGEGWHNNHHAAPACHRFGNITGDRPHEYDLPAWIIEKLGYEKGSREFCRLAMLDSELRIPRDSE